jgi:hypothetical protein
MKDVSSFPDLPTDRKERWSITIKTCLPGHHRPLSVLLMGTCLKLCVEDCGERLHVDLKTQKKLVAMPYITPRSWVSCVFMFSPFKNMGCILTHFVIFSLHYSPKALIPTTICHGFSCKFQTLFPPQWFYYSHWLQPNAWQVCDGQTETYVVSPTWAGLRFRLVSVDFAKLVPPNWGWCSSGNSVRIFFNWSIWNWGVSCSPHPVVSQWVMDAQELHETRFTIGWLN